MVAYIEHLTSDHDLLAQISEQLIEANRQLALRDARIRDLERQVQQLMCWGVVAFADGELDQERADAFAAHLKACTDCQCRLTEVLQMNARLSALGRKDG